MYFNSLKKIGFVPSISGSARAAGELASFGGFNVFGVQAPRPRNWLRLAFFCAHQAATEIGFVR
jgi:hypothetical protein